MNLTPVLEYFTQGKLPESKEVHIYTQSLQQAGDVKIIMVKMGLHKVLVAYGAGPLFDDLAGDQRDGCKICELTHENRLVLNRYFEFTVPRAFGTKVPTIGLGDRLGRAGTGHIRTIRGRGIKPILAQQSIRELNLTGRDYKEVVDAACFAAFQEGYTDGFGADGDHLKLESDIQMAMELGFTMLTLDCSEHIRNDAADWNEDELKGHYDSLPQELREHYESRYLGRNFEVEGQMISFSETQLKRDVLIYHEAIRFMLHINETYIAKAPRKIDFEISIDETLTPTAPESHFLVASELQHYGVDIYSMAPRFIGEFQKGIDYIGDIAEFERQLAVHAAIADHFGYKLSIHSGSDKFSVFPMIGQYTKGRFHVKTAGTNWLEAVRIIAQVNPELYRSMHHYALEHFQEAAAYYHVTTDISKIVPLDQVSDADLPGYMDEDNARQLLHITYGLLLQAKDEQGQYLFKNDFFRTLDSHEEAYQEALMRHIGKHLDLLGVARA